MRLSQRGSILFDSIIALTSVLLVFATMHGEARLFKLLREVSKREAQLNTRTNATALLRYHNHHSGKYQLSSNLFKKPVLASCSKEQLSNLPYALVKCHLATQENIPVEYLRWENSIHGPAQ